MTIEDLLNQLEYERKVLEERYSEYYMEAVKAKREIKEYYTDPFLRPDEIPQKSIDEHEYWCKKHAETVFQHNRILDAINIIKVRVGG
jgi:hypothetical protein